MDYLFIKIVNYKKSSSVVWNALVRLNLNTLINLECYLKTIVLLKKHCNDINEQWIMNNEQFWIRPKLSIVNYQL